MRLVHFKRESPIGMFVIWQPRVPADQRVITHRYQCIVSHERL